MTPVGMSWFDQEVDLTTIGLVKNGFGKLWAG
jgi:hypothetical protein